MSNLTVVTKKYALITGATGGIGKAISHALIESGYTLILHGRTPAKLQKFCEELPGDHYFINADISQLSACKRLVEQALEIGPVELLVNNAGVSHFSEFTSPSLNDEDTSVLMQINLVAPMLLSKHLISHLGRNEKLTIVNIGSALGSIGFPGFSIYCATKFGLRGFSETLAREFADNRNIRVAYFAPRTTETTINSKAAIAMNQSLKTKVDSPQFVAKQFMKLLNSKSRRKVVGWPEKLFARINGLLPEIVDKAFVEKNRKIKQFTHVALGEQK